MVKPTAIIYVDGLNLYRQCLSGSPELKWLDVQKLCEYMLPTHQIVSIRYFTSIIKQPIGNPGAPLRQRMYLRALEAFVPKLTIHLGTMRFDTKRYRKVPFEFDPLGKPVLVKVQKLEEKGTDVSLASHMVFDAAINPADLHVLISGDGDFAPTISLLRDSLSEGVAILAPSNYLARPLLESKPHLIRTIHRDALRKSQLPTEIMLQKGFVRRPAIWS